jgi:hypothetical protein
MLKNGFHAYRRSLVVTHVSTRRRLKRVERELAEERDRVERLRAVLNPRTG